MLRRESQTIKTEVLILTNFNWQCKPLSFIKKMRKDLFDLYA